MSNLTGDGLVAAYTTAMEAGDWAEAARLAALIDSPSALAEARLRAPGALARAAGWYASQGLPVFPCHPGTKQPATRHGFKDASTDPGTVRAWWGQTPRANIGTPTGILFDVIDVDGDPGKASLWELQRQDAVPEIIGRASTPRGVHLYIRATGDGNTTAIEPGIDYRGRGGYVIIPPSRLENGAYRWLLPPALPSGS